MAGGLALSVLACLTFSDLPAAAQDNGDGIIGIELNGLETLNGNCRVTLLSTNGLEADLQRLVAELVFFDRDRRALRFVRVALPQLPSQRSRAQVFDMEGLACEGVATVLFNGTVECTADGISPDDCAAAVTPSSRADVPLVTGFNTDTRETEN